MNNMHLLLCSSGSGQQPLTQPRELEPHGTGTHLTPPFPTQLLGATQPRELEPHGTGTHLAPPSRTLLLGATKPRKVSGSLMEEGSFL